MLSAESLCLIRGDRCLFEHLSFSVDAGELLVVEGANGSGKTSLLKGVAGLFEFTEGDLFWNGENVRKRRQAFCASLAWFSHRNGFKADLSPLENLGFESGLRAASAMPVDAAMQIVGAERLANLPIRVLSAGQQRRIGLARMLLSSAPLWLLDEPFTNLDTHGQDLVRRVLGEHLDTGGLAIVATHHPIDIGSRSRSIRL